MNPIKYSLIFFIKNVYFAKVEKSIEMTKYTKFDFEKVLLPEVQIMDSDSIQKVFLEAQGTVKKLLPQF